MPNSTITTTFKAINEISPVMAQIDSSVKQVISSIDTLDSKMNGIKAGGLGSVENASNNAKKAIGGLGTEAQSTGGKLNTIGDVSTKLKKTGSTISGIGKTLTGVGKAGSAVTGVLGAMTAGAVKTSLGFNKIYQSSQIIFERMLGGTEQAKAMYNDLYNIATHSAFPIESFLQASKQLVGVGISAKNTTMYMQAMTDAVSAFGGEKEELDQLAFAFRRVATNGRVSMMEVNMMADDGVNALQILGNHYGKTTEEMRDMIAEEFVPAEEALQVICEGIEKGSNGVAGATQAMGGMAAAMKGKTLTGAFDSMHTSIRQFCLNLLDMDARTDSGAKRINQLTAAVVQINKIIESCAPIFKGITDAVGKFLDKLIGAKPVWNDQTATWENTGGILVDLQNKLNTMDPKKLASIGNMIVKVGTTAPVLYGVGKALTTVGKTMEKLSKNKEALEKVYNLLQKPLHLPQLSTPDVPKIPETKTKATTSVEVDSSKVDGPFNALLTKANNFKDKFKSLFHRTGAESADELNEASKGGLSKFIDNLTNNFKAGQTKMQETLDFMKQIKNEMKSEVAEDFSNMFTYKTDVKSMTGVYKKPKPVDIEPEIETKDSGSFITRIFNRLNEKVNTEGKTFGQNIRDAISNNLPKGDSIGSKTKSIFTNLGQSSKEVGKAGLGIVKAIIPDNATQLVKNATEGMKNQLTDFSGGAGKIFEALKGHVSEIFKAISTALTQAVGFLVEGLKALVAPFAPLISAIGGVVGPIMGFAVALGVALGGVIAITAGIGLFVGMLGKMGGAAIDSTTGVAKGVLNVSNIFTNFNKNVANATAGVVGAIRGIVKDIVDNFPTYATVGGQMIAQFVMGVITSIPQLITAGAQIVIEFISGVIQAIPALVQAGFNAISGFVTGIQNNLPAIGASIQQMVNDIGKCLQDNWPLIQGKGQEILTNLCTGFSTVLPQIWGLITSVASMIGQGIQNNLPLIAQKGGEIIGGLINGIISGIPWLLGQAVSLVQQFAGFIIDNRWNIINAGIGLIQSIVDGVGTLLPVVIDSLKNAGMAILNGLLGGLSGAWAQISQWFTDSFNWIVNTVLSIFQIGSPSKVFSGIGGDIIAGFLGGLQEGWNTVVSWANEAWNWFTGLFSGQNQQDEQASGADLSATIASTQEQLNQLSQLVTQTFGQITVALNGLVAGMSNAILSGFGQMSTVLIQNVDALAVNLPVHLAVMIPPFVNVFAQATAQSAVQLALLSQTVQNSIAVLITTMATNLQGLTGVFSNAFASVLQVVTTSLQNFATIATNTLTAMTQSLSAIVDAFRADYVAKWEAIKNEVVGKIETLKSEAVTKMNALHASLKSVGESIHTDFVDAIKRTCDDALKHIQDFKQSVIDNMDDLPASFRTIGGNMMTELLAGINEQKGQVEQGVKDLVENLKNVFLTGLGIHSPSRFMTYVGKMMAAGLMGGLSRDDMKAFAEAVIGDMKNSFKQGKFDPNQLVDYLGEDTEKVIQYLLDTGDNTVSEAMGGGQSGVPPIVQAAEKHVGYIANGTSIFGAKYGNPGGAWCAYFVRAMAEESGVPFPATGYVPDVMAWAQSNGRWTQTPVPGYAAIFGGGSHIELVAEVSPDGNVTTIGGNTGSPRGVYKHVRNGATGYVALDGGHPIAMTLRETIEQAYLNKMISMLTQGGHFNMELFSRLFPKYAGAMNLDVTGSGLLNPGWFQQWVPPPEVARWAPQVLAVLAMLHQPPSLLKGVLWAINGESSGDPNSTYLGDINVIYGGSKGLLQTITPNFERWKNPNLPNNIYDPMQNIWTCLREMQDTYGGIAQLINRKIARGHWSGYKRGTDSATPGLHWVGENGPELLQFRGGERVYTNTESMRIVENTVGSDTKNLLEFEIAPLITQSLSAKPESVDMRSTREYVKYYYNYLSSQDFVPGFARGSRRIPEDMLAMIHEGEAVIPKTQNPYSETGGNYLRDIGDTITQEVLGSVINIDKLHSYYPEEEYQTPEEYPASTMTTVTPVGSSTPTVNLQVSIGNINTESDWQSAEERVVQMVNNALQRAYKANGAVQRVY